MEWLGSKGCAQCHRKWAAVRFMSVIGIPELPFTLMVLNQAPLRSDSMAEKIAEPPNT